MQITITGFSEEGKSVKKREFVLLCKTLFGVQRRGKRKEFRERVLQRAERPTEIGTVPECDYDPEMRLGEGKRWGGAALVLCMVTRA